MVDVWMYDTELDMCYEMHFAYICRVSQLAYLGLEVRDLTGAFRA